MKMEAEIAMMPLQTKFGRHKEEYAASSKEHGFLDIFIWFPPPPFFWWQNACLFFETIQFIVTVLGNQYINS